MVFVVALNFSADFFMNAKNAGFNAII